MLLKNKLTDKDRMNGSNNNKYVLKCYINLFDVVVGVIQGGYALAMRIKQYSVLIKKIINFTYFHSHNSGLIRLVYQ